MLRSGEVYSLSTYGNLAMLHPNAASRSQLIMKLVFIEICPLYKNQYRIEGTTKHLWIDAVQSDRIYIFFFVLKSFLAFFLLIEKIKIVRVVVEASNKIAIGPGISTVCVPWRGKPLASYNRPLKKYANFSFSLHFWV